MGSPQESREDIRFCRRCRKHWCGFEIFLFEQCWVYALELLVLLFSCLSLALVIKNSSYSLNIEADQVTGFPELSDSTGVVEIYGNVLFAKYDRILKAPVCTVTNSWDEEFSASPEIKVGAGFVICFISLNILSLSALVVLQILRGFTDVETLPSYRFRALLLFQSVMLLVTIISASIIWIGISVTCTNLPASGCYISCCDCLEYVCFDSNNAGAFCSEGSPNAVSSDNFRNAIQAQAAASNLLWVNSVFIIVIMLLFGCMMGSKRTWSSKLAKERATRQGTKL